LENKRFPLYKKNMLEVIELALPTQYESLKRLPVTANSKVPDKFSTICPAQKVRIPRKSEKGRKGVVVRHEQKVGGRIK
jgi:hypothetical protein